MNKLYGNKNVKATPQDENQKKLSQKTGGTGGEIKAYLTASEQKGKDKKALSKENKEEMSVQNTLGSPKSRSKLAGPVDNKFGNKKPPGGPSTPIQKTRNQELNGNGRTPGTAITNNTNLTSSKNVTYQDKNGPVD